MFSLTDVQVWHIGIRYMNCAARERPGTELLVASASSIYSTIMPSFFNPICWNGVLQFKSQDNFKLAYKTSVIVSEVMKA